MGAQAARLALADAGVGYERVQQAYVGYVYGDSTCGQRALYEVGLTGVPIVNVNNNCSTGSTALVLARQAIDAGADCVLALGFEQMKPGALGAVFTDRPTPFDRFDAVTEQLVGESQIPLALRYFGGAGREHMQRYGTPLEAFAQIRAKASRHAEKNPFALFRTRAGVIPVLLACGAAGLVVRLFF
jgi:acetyl-CoA acetyltransferase